jgi:hypothetical protein
MTKVKANTQRALYSNSVCIHDMVISCGCRVHHKLINTDSTIYGIRHNGVKDINCKLSKSQQQQ